MIIDNISDSDIFLIEKEFPNIFNNKGIKQDVIDNPFSKYLFYFLDGCVKGFLNYTLIYDRIEIININVLDQFQKQGIASKLMDKLLEIARYNNSLNITLEVKIDNFKAIRLYEKYLFKKVATRKGYYNGVDALLMERSM